MPVQTGKRAELILVGCAIVACVGFRHPVRRADESQFAVDVLQIVSFVQFQSANILTKARCSCPVAIELVSSALGPDTPFVATFVVDVLLIG